MKVKRLSLVILTFLMIVSMFSVLQIAKVKAQTDTTLPLPPTLPELVSAYGSASNGSNWNSNADLDGNGIIGLSDLVLFATSLEIGSPSSSSPVWLRYGNVLTGNQAWEQNTICEPTVITDNNPQILSGSTVFKMWYRGGWYNEGIGYAESYDGKTWIKYSGNPILTGVSQPFVMKDGSTYYMFANTGTGINGGTVNNAIERLHSSDGINWLNDGIVITGNATSNNYVWKEGTNDWRMIFDYINTIYNYTLVKVPIIPAPDGIPAWRWVLELLPYRGWAIGYATSSDGLNWTQSNFNPIISSYGGGAGQVYKDGSTYYLWTWGNPDNTLPCDLYRWKSNNLVNWTSNPFDTPSFARETFDEGVGNNLGQVADECLLQVNNQVYMYYTANTDATQPSGVSHTKLAIANMTLSSLVLTNENS